MLDSNVFIDFHFLRPAWLLALLPVVMVWLIVGRRGDVIRQWRKVIAPHLLAHLSVGSQDRWRFRPLHLTILVLLLGIIGLAGPTWEREISPFAEDTAPLIIVLDLSASMNAARSSSVRRMISFCAGSMSARTSSSAADAKPRWASVATLAAASTASRTSALHEL